MRPLFRRRPRVPTGPLRVLVLKGEHAGCQGWCFERDRFHLLTMIPVDLDSGQHIHLAFDAVRVVED